MTPVRKLALGALALANACAREAPLPEVRVLVSTDLPAVALAGVAGWARRARVVLAARPEDAELAWLDDPTQALALGDRAAPGSAPAAAGVPGAFLDPRGRFAPLGARARVLLVRPAARLPFEPTSLRHVGDPHLRGRVALTPLGTGHGPVTVAALVLAHGTQAADRLVTRLADNAPVLCASDAAVRARVASGDADLGLVGSPEAAESAASAARLKVVWPDQSGRGAVVLPTALVVLPGAGEAARSFAEWLVGPEGERLVVARVPGLLPLRPGVPVPPGVEPAGNLRALPLDWDALSDETRSRSRQLARWPEGFTEGGIPAGH